MTLSGRSIILLIGIIVSFLIMLAFGITIFLLFRENFTLIDLPFTEEASVFSLRLEKSEMQLYWILAAIGMKLVLAVFGGIILRKYFRKIAAPAMFFFILFIFFLSFEGFRAGQLLVIVLNLPDYLGVVVSRLVYFGHFSGLFCLFIASLFIAGVQYQKLGTVLGIAIFIALLIAYTVPVDSSVLYAGLLHKVGWGYSVQLISLFILIFIVMNHIYGAFQFRAEERGMLIPAILLIVIGKFFVFFMPHPISLTIGIAFVYAGSLLYSVRNFKIYFWF